MDDWNNTILIGAGALGMWLLKLIAGKFIDKKYQLEQDDINELKQTVDKIEQIVTEMAKDEKANKEKWSNFVDRFDKLDERINNHGERLRDVEIKIAKI